MPPVDGFDHAIIGVDDLAAARLAWRRLGFTTCPRGRHIGWGTANYCIMFEDDYLELLGMVDAEQFTNNLDVFLADHGPGLLGMAFAGRDVKALAERLGGRPQDLKRLLELPEGTVEPRFRLLHPRPGTLPGMNGFICQHLSSELMRRPQWLVHANGATGIAAVNVAVDDPAAASATYGKLLGGRFVADKMVFTEVDGRTGLVELSLRVVDISRTAAFMDEAGIPCRQSKDRIQLPPEQATGVSLSFV